MTKEPVKEEKKKTPSPPNIPMIPFS